MENVEEKENQEAKSSFPSDYLSAASLDKALQLRLSTLFKEFEKVVPDIREQLILAETARVFINNEVKVKSLYKIPVMKWLTELGLDIKAYRIFCEFFQGTIKLEIDKVISKPN